jgi:hypothetical protein
MLRPAVLIKQTVLTLAGQRDGLFSHLGWRFGQGCEQCSGECVEVCKDNLATASERATRMAARKLLKSYSVNGEPGGARTRDHRIKSAMLYQLSYRLN